jgi:hypothetical protein
MPAALKVTRASRALLGTRITVKAKRNAQAVFDSFLGERVFRLDEGDRLTLVVRGRDWQEGDRLSLAELVSSTRDWTKIPWAWS